MSKRKKSKVGLILIAVICAYFIYIMVGQEKLLIQKQNEMKKIEAKIEDEKALNEELQKQKQEVNSDSYVERIAREKLGMVKPGEKVFVDVNR